MTDRVATGFLVLQLLTAVATIVVALVALAKVVMIKPDNPHAFGVVLELVHPIARVWGVIP